MTVGFTGVNREDMAITVENARELQANSVASRRIYSTERTRLNGRLMDLETKIDQICGVIERGANPDKTIMAQLRQLDLAIEAKPDPADLVRLVQAKATLYSLIHPKPGVARPRRTRQPQSLPLPEPAQEPRPSQVPAQPSTRHMVPGTTPAQG